jgi:hypothetical protein
MPILDPLVVADAVGDVNGKQSAGSVTLSDESARELGDRLLP